MMNLQMLCFFFCFSLFFAFAFASNQSGPPISITRSSSASSSYPYNTCSGYLYLNDPNAKDEIIAQNKPAHCEPIHKYSVALELSPQIYKCYMYPSKPHVFCNTMYNCDDKCYVPDRIHSNFYGEGCEIPKDEANFVELSYHEPFTVTVTCEPDDSNYENYTALVFILCTVLFLVVVATIVVACCVMGKKKKTLVVEKVTDYGTTSTVCVQPQIYPQAQYVQPLLYPQPQPVQPQTQTSNQQPNHHQQQQQQQQQQQFYLVSNQPINSHEGQMPPMPQYMLYSQQQQQ